MCEEKRNSLSLVGYALGVGQWPSCKKNCRNVSWYAVTAIAFARGETMLTPKQLAVGLVTQAKSADRKDANRLLDVAGRIMATALTGRSQK